MENITFNDVTLRDGLQSYNFYINTKDKVKLANLIIEANIKDIELTSFVNPKLVPQLKDAKELASSKDLKDANFSALIPNIKGFKRALNTRIKEVVLFISACPEHNIKNLGKSIEESLNDFDEIFKINEHFKIKPAISMVFGSPFTNHLPEDKILFNILSFFIQKGVEEITLCDTWGNANAKIFEKQLQKILKFFDNTFFSLHLHNINGQGEKNMEIALDNGINKFDTVFGLTGGCPFSIEAGINLNIRNAIKIVEKKGFKHSININTLEKVENFLNNLIKREGGKNEL